jgi:hypothetical protein
MGDMLAEAAWVYTSNTLWRATGSRAAGRALVRALGSPDATARTIAGMFLVQGGKRAKPLLREALARREHLPLLLTIIGDVGDPSFDPDVRRLSQDPDPQVARAAREALRVMNLRHTPAR